MNTQRRTAKWFLNRFGTNERFEVKVGMTKLGRHKSNDVICMPKSADMKIVAKISRNHCSIEFLTPDVLILRDVSSNGTTVNKKLYLQADVRLQDKDLIFLGVDVPETKFILSKVMVKVEDDVISLGEDESDCESEKIDVISIPDSEDENGNLLQILDPQHSTNVTIKTDPSDVRPPVVLEESDEGECDIIEIGDINSDGEEETYENWRTILSQSVLCQETKNSTNDDDENVNNDVEEIVANDEEEEEEEENIDYNIKEFKIIMGSPLDVYKGIRKESSKTETDDIRSSSNENEINNNVASRKRKTPTMVLHSELQKICDDDTSSESDIEPLSKLAKVSIPLKKNKNVTEERLASVLEDLREQAKKKNSKRVVSALSSNDGIKTASINKRRLSGVVVGSSSCSQQVTAVETETKKRLASIKRRTIKNAFIRESMDPKYKEMTKPAKIRKRRNTIANNCLQSSSTTNINICTSVTEPIKIETTLEKTVVRENAELKSSTSNEELSAVRTSTNTNINTLQPKKIANRRHSLYLPPTDNLFAGSENPVISSKKLTGKTNGPILIEPHHIPAKRGYRNASIVSNNVIKPSTTAIEKKKKLEEIAFKRVSIVNQSLALAIEKRVPAPSKVKVTPMNRGEMLSNDIINGVGVKNLKPVARIIGKPIQRLRSQSTSVRSPPINFESPIIPKPLKSCLKSANYSKKKSVVFDNTITEKKISRYIPKDAPFPEPENNVSKFHVDSLESSDSVDNILNEILKWNPNLLNKENYDSIIGKKRRLIPISNSFTNLDNYRNTFLPFMLLELWSHIVKDYKSIKDYISIVVESSKIGSSGSSHRLTLTCNYKSEENQKQPATGELIIIRAFFKGTWLMSFGYVQSVRDNPKFHMTYLTIDTDAENKYFTDSPIQIVVVSSIYYQLGPFHALSIMNESPLMNSILQPLENIVMPAKYPIMDCDGCDPLNRNQYDTVSNMYNKCIDLTVPNILLLDGPPGTGKSRVITNLIYQLVCCERFKPRIIVCASTNAAVDILTERLLGLRKRAKKKFNILRFGIHARMTKAAQSISIDTKVKVVLEDNNKFRMQTLNTHENNRDNLLKKITELSKNPSKASELEKCRRDLNSTLLAIDKNMQSSKNNHRDKKEAKLRSIQKAQIICSTVGSAYSLFRYTQQQKFDICIIDEATQCLESNSLIPTMFGIRKLILVGDTQQLPAMTLSKVCQNYNFNMSLFSRIQKSYDCLKDDPIYHLNTQYRMHSEIVKWPNFYFYKSSLLTPFTTVDNSFPLKRYCVLNLLSNQNMTQSVSCYNSDEIEFVAFLLSTIFDLISSKGYTVGIITPYARHRSELIAKIKHMKLKNVTVYTIDAVQGREEDIVIISLARTFGVGFMDNEQRLNVALTRAKESLMIVGNFEDFQKCHLYESLLQDAIERNVYYDVDDDIQIAEIIRA